MKPERNRNQPHEKLMFINMPARETGQENLTHIILITNRVPVTVQTSTHNRQQLVIESISLPHQFSIDTTMTWPHSTSLFHPEPRSLIYRRPRPTTVQKSFQKGTKSIERTQTGRVFIAINRIEMCLSVLRRL